MSQPLPNPPEQNYPRLVTNSQNEELSNLKPKELDETQEKLFKSSSEWFYWVAGFSIVNSVLIISGADVSFLCGLGVTQIIDILFSSIQDELATTIGLFITMFFAFVFAVCGFFARKRWGWAFILGILFYGIDLLVVILLGDWLAVAFHCWVMFNLINGYVAYLKL